MFGSIGMQELIIIFVIALIIFGPRQLPDLGKSLGPQHRANSSAPRTTCATRSKTRSAWTSSGEAEDRARGATRGHDSETTPGSATGRPPTRGRPITTPIQTQR